jgi:hypothetical protein
VGAALRFNSSRHPTITKAWRERAWWNEYGQRLDPRPLDERPWREVEEYETLRNYTLRYRPPQPSTSPPQQR